MSTKQVGSNSMTFKTLLPGIIALILVCVALSYGAYSVGKYVGAGPMRELQVEVSYVGLAADTVLFTTTNYETFLSIKEQGKKEFPDIKFFVSKIIQEDRKK